MKNSIFLSLLVLCMAILVACKDNEGTPTPTLEITTITATVGDVTRTGIVDPTAKTVSFQPFAPRTELSAVAINVTLPEGVTVTPESGSTHDFTDGAVEFTITNGAESATFAVTVTAEFAPSIAFVGAANGAGSITEPDMKAAFDYLSETYGEELEYINFSSVNDDALRYLNVVVIYIDTDAGNNPGLLEAIPASAKAESVVTAFKNWHAAGGHFVLAGMGTQYLNQLGRLPADGDKPYEENGWAPRIYGSGDGFDNADQWGVNADLNVNALETVSTANWNRRTHPVWAGLATSDLANPETGGTYPTDIYTLVGAGYKEDHNSMWDLNAAPITNHVDAFDKADKWEAAMEASILGTWGHVVDLCCGAVVELHARAGKPNEGKIIAIGAAAYEWEQNGAANPFVNNVQDLTTNSINYLLEQ